MNLTWTYPYSSPMMMRSFLQEKGITKTFLAHVKRNGKLLVNGREEIVLKTLVPGDVLTMVIPPEGEHETVVPSHIPLDILFEDDYLLIVNKPQGTASIPSQLHPDQSMANRVKGYLKTTRTQDCVTHVVTRLDRDTTGVMMFAKHRVVHAWMDQALRNKMIQKTYHAIVSKQDVLKEHDLIDEPIGRTDDSIINRCVRPDGKPSLTEYWLEETYQHSQLVKIRLHTGRTHQIRVHFSWLGCPLLGDDLYGGKKIEPLVRQALHCSQLDFVHPMTGEKMCVKAPLPTDMAEWIEKDR